MTNFGWIKNPLSVIALFISLIYGTSALFFGTAVGSLSADSQARLVTFVIAFPFAVLGVFAWLVMHHHQKLYGPGDYKDENLFGDTFRNASPAEIAVRNETETKEVTADQQSPSAEETSKPTGSSESAIQNAPGAAPSAVITRTYFLESLAFQDLQIRFGGSARRHVILQDNVFIEGVIETPSAIFLIEIKTFIGQVHSYRSLTSASFVLQQAKRLLSDKEHRKVETVLALVATNIIDVSGLNLGVDQVITYNSNDLMARFGFPSIPTIPPS